MSRYLYRLWRDRRDLQSHFPDSRRIRVRIMAFLVERGHDDTNIPCRLPSH